MLYLVPCLPFGQPLHIVYLNCVVTFLDQHGYSCLLHVFSMNVMKCGVFAVITWICLVLIVIKSGLMKSWVNIDFECNEIWVDEIMGEYRFYSRQK